MAKTIDIPDLKKLTPFKKMYMTIGEIPTTYLDSMTYTEMIMLLTDFIQNKVIPVVNNNAEATEELKQAVIDLKNYVDNYFEQPEVNIKLRQLINEVITPIIESLDSKIDSNYTELYELIVDDYNKLSTIINNNFELQKRYIDTNVANLQYQIDNFSVDNIKIYDPTTGLISPIEDVIYNIYDVTRNNAITAIEFDNVVGLTCQIFDNYEMTAFQFDNSAKSILL